MSTTSTRHTGWATELLRSLRGAGWGCIAEGCYELRQTCAEMCLHIDRAHPELAEPEHEACYRHLLTIS